MSGEIRVSGKMRIMGTWGNRNTDIGEFYSFHMILIDRFGDQTHSTITPKQFDMHREKLKEQNIISMKFVSIAEFTETF
ncbi:hypothetical protein MKX01_029695 [Papaver californicum]|nr:hypothetical protein MKX01_029695 [Papaver californicum]